MSVTATDNAEFIRNYFAEMRETSGRQDVIDRFVADEQLKLHICWAKSVAPDYYIVAEQMVSEGDTVAVRGKVNGIHRGEFNGIPPTGKQFSVDVAVFYRVKMERSWTIGWYLMPWAPQINLRLELSACTSARRGRVHSL